MPERYIGRKFKTKFLREIKVHSKAIRQMIDIGRSLNSKGLTPANAGNFSVRTEHGMLITCGGKNKGHLEDEDFVEVLSFDGIRNMVNVVGIKEPSSEVPMHWLIYGNSDVNAIIHAHDSSVVENPGGHVITEGEHPYGTMSQAKDVAKALEKSNYVIIRNHGVIAVGKTLSDAMALILDRYDL